jgi:putative iron-regulated protein
MYLEWVVTSSLTFSYCIDMRFSVGLMLPLVPVVLAACGDSSVGPGSKMNQGVIVDEVNSVFLPNIDSLAARGARLETAITTLAALPNAANLSAAQSAWKLTRVSYEYGEAFSFGPIETDGIDPAVDTWPVDMTGINALINGPDSLTTPFIDGLDPTLKGFHAVEFVLFGAPGTPTVAAALTPRQLEYLVTAGQDLSNELTELETAWSTSGGNFATQVLDAGQSNSSYSSQAAAMQDIVTQMATQPAQVIYKLQQPLTTDSSYYEESLFSDNTQADIASNIAGTAAMYFGAPGSTMHGGLGAIVRANDPSLDATVRAQFAEAEAAIAKITPTFNVALYQDPALLQNAAQAALNLQKTMINLVAPLLGVGNAGPLGGQPDND